MPYFTLHNFPLENKTIFLRVDYNVPLEKGKVIDDYKIKASLPTINYLLQRKCKLVLATHLGRPEGKFVSALKTDPLAQELQKLMSKIKVIKLNDCIGPEIKARIENAKPNEIFLLENLRFYSAEEDNNEVFAHSLASLADIYVNDAFAVSHRKQASVNAIARFLPSVAGLLFEKEITELSKALYPERPSAWILGGAKLDKVELLQQALQLADTILVGGALAFPFMRVQGIPVGMSKLDTHSVQIARKILHHKKAKKIIFPVDFMVAGKFSPSAKASIVPYNKINANTVALDIGPQTIKLFKRHLLNSHTVLWNGPLGYCEWASFSQGTKQIARYLGKLELTAIAGGGETVEFLRKFHVAHNFTHLSTGGGATIEFLSGRKFLGIQALEENYKQFKTKF